MIWCIMKRLKVLFTAFTQKRLERKAYLKLKSLNVFATTKNMTAFLKHFTLPRCLRINAKSGNATKPLLKT